MNKDNTRHTPSTVSVPSTELNIHSGQVMRRVAVDREHVIIERHGFPLVVMIPFHEYQRYLENEKRLAEIEAGK